MTDPTGPEGQEERPPEESRERAPLDERLAAARRAEEGNTSEGEENRSTMSGETLVQPPEVPRRLTLRPSERLRSARNEYRAARDDQFGLTEDEGFETNTRLEAARDELEAAEDEQRIDEEAAFLLEDERSRFPDYANRIADYQLRHQGNLPPPQRMWQGLTDRPLRSQSAPPQRGEEWLRHARAADARSELPQQEEEELLRYEGRQTRDARSEPPQRGPEREGQDDWQRRIAEAEAQRTAQRAADRVRREEEQARRGGSHEM